MSATSDEEYLEQTVYNSIQAGLAMLERDRPVAPIETLAVFLLKHADEQRAAESSTKDEQASIKEPDFAASQRI